MPGTSQITVTIANGAPASGSFPLYGSRIVAVISPAEWTAADITFEVETAQGSNAFVKVVDRAGVIFKLAGIATAVAEMHLIGGDANQSDIIITSPGSAKIVSTNTASEADVNQGAARTLVVVIETW